MPDTETLLQRLIDGGPTLVEVDVAAALAQANAAAATTRERQLVALTAAYLDHDDDLLDALVRDHLDDHADSALARRLQRRPTHLEE